MKRRIASALVSVGALTVAGCGLLLGDPSPSPTTNPDAGDATAPTTNDAPLGTDTSSAGEAGDAGADGDGPADASGLAETAPDAANPGHVSGAPDTTFGDQGVFTLTLNAVDRTDAGELDRIAIQSDGKILYSGFTSCDGGRFAFVGRVLADGGPDLSFNAAGAGGYVGGCKAADEGIVWLTPGPSGPNVVNAWVSALSTGEIAVAGTVAPDNGSNDSMFASQYSPEGTLDIGFADAGYAFLTPSAVPAIATDFVAWDGGDFFVAGSANGVSTVVSAAPNSGAVNASFDPSSGDGGTGAATFAGTEITAVTALQTTGGQNDLIAAVAGAGTTVGIAVDTATGSPDKELSGGAFSPIGCALLTSSAAAPNATSRAAALPDKSFVFVGTTATTVEILHFAPDGQFDSAYGPNHDGCATPIPFSPTVVSDAIATSDGKLLVAGLPPPVGNPELWRVKGDGTLDHSFAEGSGLWTLPDLAKANTQPQGSGAVLAIDAENRILAGAIVYLEPDGGTCCNAIVEIARFWP